MRMLRVRDVMTREVVAVTPGTSFRHIAGLIVHNRIGAVPVLDEAGRLVGLISEADLVSKQAYGGRRWTLLGGILRAGQAEARGMARSRSRVASDLMSAPVETVTEDDPLRVVARRMVENHLRHMVVVDANHRVVGIVSRRDLLRAFDQPDEDIATGVRAVLAQAPGVADGQVSAWVEEGVVTLEGQVADLHDVPAVCRLAWLVPGVVDVVNHLDVVPRARVVAPQRVVGAKPEPER
jgi:CBS domain-containing protein